VILKRMADETLTIETPEHVELQFALASIGNRFLACAADHALQFAAIGLVIFAAFNLSSAARELGTRVAAGVEEGRLWIFAVATLGIFVLYFGYFAFFETIWNGQTPGKRWFGLRVILEDGRPINFFAALSRNLLRSVDMMPFFLFLPFYSIGIVAVFASARGKRLGDFVAGTVVIKERSAEAPSFAEVFESEVIDTARRRLAPPVDIRGDLRALTPAEVETVEAFLRRRDEIPPRPRQWLAWRISVPLLEKIRPSYDPATFSYEGFLEELLARTRR
jgi:uncharacterized RDD family membrane protein YckC